VKVPLQALSVVADWRRRAAAVAIAIAVSAPLAAAQPQTGASRKFEIVDNSFLVEESFNQEAGIFQNILTWTRNRDGQWVANFTQEWPVRTMTHQLSYSVPFGRISDSAGLGDVFVNYRYQLLSETDRAPAISPRISVVLPTGNESTGLGGGGVGFQINVPVSKQFGNLYLHGNAGGTWIRRLDWTTQLAASGIVRVRPMIHLMVETVSLVGESFTFSPGIRGGWNVGDQQIVIGAAVPITRFRGETTPALLTYLSYELRFTK